MSKKEDMSTSEFGLGLPGAEPRKANDELFVTGPLHMAVRPPTPLLVVDAAEVEVRVIALTADDWALVEEVLIHNAQTQPLMRSSWGSSYPRWSPLLSVRNSLMSRENLDFTELRRLRKIEAEVLDRREHNREDAEAQLGSIHLSRTRRVTTQADLGRMQEVQWCTDKPPRGNDTLTRIVNQTTCPECAGIWRLAHPQPSESEAKSQPRGSDEADAQECLDEGMSGE